MKIPQPSPQNTPNKKSGQSEVKTRDIRGFFTDEGKAELSESQTSLTLSSSSLHSVNSYYSTTSANNSDNIDTEDAPSQSNNSSISSNNTIEVNPECITMAGVKPNKEDNGDKVTGQPINTTTFNGTETDNKKPTSQEETDTLIANHTNFKGNAIHTQPIEDEGDNELQKQDPNKKSDVEEVMDINEMAGKENFTNKEVMYTCSRN